MSGKQKLIQRMRDNPRDWEIKSLETIALRFNIHVRKTGGSHVVFLHEESDIVVTVPARRPIKPIYIVQFLTLIDDICGEL
jgi:predicted RNA binding protein YcfA (HicA-like mRNA interferase family)